MPSFLDQRTPVLIAAVVLGTACGVAPGRSAGPGELATGTWSIVGVDVGTREVGVALASCLPAALSISSSEAAADAGTGVRSYSVFGRVNSLPSFELARLIAGVGAIAAQGLVDQHNADRLDRATARLLAGAPPEVALEGMTAGDPLSERRQYGVATLARGAAGFTGGDSMGWAGALSDDVVSVQGNILVGPEVLSEALAAFQEEARRPEAALSDALVAALEAGAAAGGDKRCPREQAALAAFVAVAHPDDTGEAPSLWVAAGPQERGEESPVRLLREAYDAGEPSPGAISVVSDVGRHVWWLAGLLALLLIIRALWTPRGKRGE